MKTADGVELTVGKQVTLYFCGQLAEDGGHDCLPYSVNGVVEQNKWGVYLYTGSYTTKINTLYTTHKAAVAAFHSKCYDRQFELRERIEQLDQLLWDTV